MANNGNSTNITQPTIPLFSGESYDFWSIKMKTLFKSQELWDLVEKGYSDPDNDANRLKENKKKDAKALFIIQQAMHGTIFPRISSAATSQEAWKILKTEFQGSARVIAVKLQILSREFETFLMKEDESIQGFLSRASGIISQIRALGETISEKKIVSKVLRSLPSKFDTVVSAIEESKDMSVYSFDELKGPLLTHEVRMNRAMEKSEDKAFHQMYS